MRNTYKKLPHLILILLLLAMPFVEMGIVADAGDESVHEISKESDELQIEETETLEDEQSSSSQEIYESTIEKSEETTKTEAEETVKEEIPETGAVQLTNMTDQDAHLQGTKYTLYKHATVEDSDVTTYKLNNGKSIQVVEIAKDLTTNAEGQVLVDELPFGEYFFVEESTVEGYETNEDLVDFKIDSEGSFDEAKNAVGTVVEVETQNIKIVEKEEEVAKDKVKEAKSDDKQEKSEDKKDKSNQKSEDQKEKSEDKKDKSDQKSDDKRNKSDGKKSKSAKKSADKKDTSDKTSKKVLEEQATKEDKVKNMQEEYTPIIPFVGDHNIDIDISPYKKEVLSGNDAAYKLVIKTTGSQINYTDATIKVDLPIEDYTQFTQNLAELKIAGVEPTYDAETHQLIYEFPELKSGQTYETLVNVNTTNGETPNNTSLTAEASFEANEQEKLTDEATVIVIASNSLAVSKEFKEARLSGEVQKAPFPRSYTIWDIKVNIPKKDVGQLFLKEGSKIVITDTFSSGLTYYDVMDGTPEPNHAGRTLTWEFDAPTIIEQAEADGDLYKLDLRVRLQVNNDDSLVGTTQENNVTIEATTIDDNTVTKTAKDEIPIVDRESATGDIEGRIMYPNHYGPADGEGNGATSDVKDPNPDVYDDAYLKFRHGITTMHPGRYYDYEEFRTDYKIDDNLIFNNIRTPGNFYFARTRAEASQYIPLAEQPEFNIVVRVNGDLKTLVTNAEHGKVYTRADLGLKDSDHVSEIRLDFTKAPAGMYARELVHYHFDVKPGYTGQVKNEYNVRTVPNQQAINDGLEVNDNGTWWYKHNSRDTWDRLASDRHATIVPRRTAQPPIATVGIELLDHENGQIVFGENRMKITLSNESSSPKSMDGPLESVVLLPKGVTLSELPNASYTDTNGNHASGNYEILEENYNNSGRQLVKVTWDESHNRIGKNVTAELDVNITTDAPSSITFDVYGFSGENELAVPNGSGETITDTILQTDDDDLNNNGVTDEPRLKSGNTYTIPGDYQLQTEKLVKGELDDDWSKFAQTIPEGKIDYRLKLMNDSGKDISFMTLIDVLPSVGDLGITDNIDRGSQFTPKLTGPIELSGRWTDKVDIVYSTAKNPKRDDLTKHTKWPDTTEQITNPAGAEDPNWMSAAEVTDWSNIHSFKIELKDRVEWAEDEAMTIEFNMEAPAAHEVETEVIDSTIEPTSRAAWNSFAVATEHGQPVEPYRVGVYMDYDIEKPEVEKTVNEQKDPYDLIDRDEVFTWEIDYDFGNYTANWQSASFQDELNDLLEIIEVTITDQDGHDVSENGELTIDRDKNIVTFDLNQQDGSFAYLANQTYTMIIETKISDAVTAKQLIEVIETGGIPNEADLIIDDEPTTSNEVVVHPPVPYGSLAIKKVDADTDDTLEGAVFELRDQDGEVVAEGITNDEGKLILEGLEIGSYTLHETKAPEGYRLLPKPLEVEITSDQLDIEIEVENTEGDWELPTVGGIGTLIFYGLGALFMIVAVTLMLRRRKTD